MFDVLDIVHLFWWAYQNRFDTQKYCLRAVRYIYRLYKYKNTILLDEDAFLIFLLLYLNIFEYKIYL